MHWFYEIKELRNSPSIQAGMDHGTEARYRREGARFILDIGTSMNLSLTTMATGVVFFHRFFMVRIFQDFYRYPTALGCLFLAGKVEETPKKCKDMLKVARAILSDEKWASFGSDLNFTKCQEEIMTLERIILQTIKFDLQVDHPHTFILKYAKCLKGDKARLQLMVQIAWRLANDCLCATLCLKWEPENIAIALMYLAGKLSKFNYEESNWWNMWVEDLTIELLENVCHQILDHFESQVQISSPSPSLNQSNGISSSQQPSLGESASTQEATYYQFPYSLEGVALPQLYQYATPYPPVLQLQLPSGFIPIPWHNCGPSSPIPPIPKSK